jgi:hypothetical protein
VTDPPAYRFPPKNNKLRKFEQHLDISPACAAQANTLADAQTELFKMDSFKVRQPAVAVELRAMFMLYNWPIRFVCLSLKAPRDKMICVLRCARFLSQVLENAGPEECRGLSRDEPDLGV